MTSKWYKVRALAQPRSAEVMIYGDIGESWWGESVTAKEFVREVSALDVDLLTVRINSYGGSVSDGIAMHNALRRHPATVTVSIDSIAASVASLIAMGGDEVEMAENAMIMIHAPWGAAVGNSVELREFADMLDTWAEAMATSYARKTGRPVDEMRALLTDGADHWIGAADAQAGGFVDRITDALPIAAAARFDLSRFRGAPERARHPAAAAALIMESKMPPEIQPPTPAESAPAPIDANAVRAQAMAEEATRRRDVRAKFSAFAQHQGMTPVMDACLDDPACTPQMAGDRILAQLAKGAAPAGGNYIVTLEDERDKVRAGLTGALMIRAGLQANDTGNPFRAHSLYDMARMSLERSGVKTGYMDKMSVVAAAFTHSTSDFTNLLANVAEKAMLKGYEEAEETFQRWTSKGTLPDFKAAKRVDISVFPTLDVVPDGAEYKYATIGDRGETIQLATYGKLFSLTRQAIINDDLDGFTRVPRKMGRAATRTVGNLVYAVLTANPNMSDGVALFHANHANLSLPGAAVITTASVGGMRAAMAKQAENGVPLNIRQAYMIVPVALGGLARQVMNSEFEVGATVGTNKANTAPNYVRGLAEVIDDARLDAASTTAWYGAANPAVSDTIEVAYLDGNEQPTLEQQGGWTVDGVEFKVRLDAGVKALDYRGLAKNAGA